MGSKEFGLVANNGYIRRTPAIDWEPKLIPGGLLGVPKKPLDFTNPYHPQNQPIYDPVIFGASANALAFSAAALEPMPPLSETTAFQKLAMALKCIDVANGKVEAFITQARALLHPPEYSITMKIK